MRKTADESAPALQSRSVVEIGDLDHKIRAGCAAAPAPGLNRSKQRYDSLQRAINNLWEGNFSIFYLHPTCIRF